MSDVEHRWWILPKRAVVVLSLALASVIGVLDYVTGRDLALSAFYLVPICWAGWAAGRAAGTVVAAVSAVVWLVADLSSGHHYRSQLIPYWNAVTLFVLFLVVIGLMSAFQKAQGRLLEALSALRRANEGLEETVQQRTAALQAEIAERKRLEFAKLQAERLAAVGTMAAQVAHEVRNPLGSITLNLDLIHKEVDKLSGTSRHPPEEGRQLVQEMRAEVQRIQRVIEDYLQFARLPKPQRRPLKLNDWLGQKLAFLEVTFGQANVALRTELDPAVGLVNADGEQLWQAILNLVRNSREAMPGGGTLTVSTGREDGQALVRISDTGKGMTGEQIGQVFVPFFTTKSEGTGLGLTLVQQIIAEHGGHVECDSTVGQGCTFTLFLPLAEAS